MKKIATFLFVAFIAVAAFAVHGKAQSSSQTPKPLHDMAENIVVHLNLPEKDRVHAIALVESIVVETLHHQGYVRIEFANGKPLHWKGDE